MNLHDLLREWRNGRAVIPFEEGRPDDISRPSWYRMGAAGKIAGVLELGRKRYLSLPVYLESFLGVPRDIVWPSQGSNEHSCHGGDLDNPEDQQ
jgi:hypothetical protein